MVVDHAARGIDDENNVFAVHRDAAYQVGPHPVFLRQQAFHLFRELLQGEFKFVLNDGADG